MPKRKMSDKEFNSIMKSLEGAKTRIKKFNNASLKELLFIIIIYTGCFITNYVLLNKNKINQEQYKRYNTILFVGLSFVAIMLLFSSFNNYYVYFISSNLSYLVIIYYVYLVVKRK